MGEENFAAYILNEKSLIQKMQILYYFKKKHELFFDNTVIFKTEIARMFLEHCRIEEVDHNRLLTECLLYGCKKTAIAFGMDQIKTYAKEGANYLQTLGFDEEFCRECMQVNRYTEKEAGEPTNAGDILEVVDNFGMLLDRDDRRAFTPIEALFILENENLHGKKNKYLETFKEFVMEFENVESLGLDKNKIITNWQTKINELPKYNIVKGIQLAAENRNQARRMYIEGKKIERNKDGMQVHKQELDAKRRLERELAQEIDKHHKFSDLLDDDESAF